MMDDTSGNYLVPMLKNSHLEQLAWEHAQSGFQCHHNLSGQFAPLFDHCYSENSEMEVFTSI